MLDAVSGHLSLLIVTETRTWTAPLPARGEVILGRGSEAAVRVDDPQLSRRHVMLRLGATTTLNDLGSPNGTTVGGRRLRPNEGVPLSLGDTISIGGSVITLQLTATSARPRRVWAHGYFEARLEEECARSDRRTRASASCASGSRGTPSPSRSPTCSARACALRTSSPSTRRKSSRCSSSPRRPRSGPGRAPVEDRFNQEGLRCRSGRRLEADGRSPEGAHRPRRDRPARVGGAPGDAFAATEPLRLGAMRRLEPLIERVAGGVINVLIVGETGVGKERLAEQVHRARRARTSRWWRSTAPRSPRPSSRASSSATRRARSPARTRPRRASSRPREGGTMFLDEIGEMPLELQAKLLRVLEEREVLRVGSVTPRAIDVRFVAATHRDLEAEVARGRFRQDLFFRLNGSRSPCRRCGSGSRNRAARARLPRKAARHAGRGRRDSRARRSRSSRAMPGRATCASCAT